MSRAKQEPLRRESDLWNVYLKLQEESEHPANTPRDRLVLMQECARVQCAAHLHDSLMGIEDQLENIATTLATGLGKGSPLVKPLWKMAKEEDGSG